MLSYLLLSFIQIILFATHMDFTSNIMITNPQSPGKKNTALNELQPPTPLGQYAHSEQEVIQKNSSFQVIVQNINHPTMPSETSPDDIKQIQLENVFQINVSYFFGVFLRSFQLSGNNGIPFICNKVSRLPYSKFVLTENIENGRTYQLVSNFTGSRYNMYVEGESRFTIVFDVSCGAESPSRQFQIFALSEKIAFNRLEGHEKQKDLDVLYYIGQNSNKILKFSSVEPKMNTQKGFLALKLSGKQVIPSVENSAIIDNGRTKVMELYKINQEQQIFQIRFSNTIEVEWSYAFALASLDFKFALE